MSFCLKLSLLWKCQAVSYDFITNHYSFMLSFAMVSSFSLAPEHGMSLWKWCSVAPICFQSPCSHFRYGVLFILSVISNYVFPWTKNSTTERNVPMQHFHAKCWCHKPPCSGTFCIGSAGNLLIKRSTE